MHLFTFCCSSSSSVIIPIPQQENPQIPLYVQNVFDRCHFNYENLPVLNMRNFGPRSRSITEIKPEHMTDPIMLFYDLTGLPGIAFHVQGKASSEKTYTLFFSHSHSVQKMSEINAVFTLYRRDRNDSQNIGSTENLYLSHALIERHEAESVCRGFAACCLNCPLNSLEGPVNPRFIEALLRGADPDFQLGRNPSSP